ncbi:tryptophan-rich sensory protein [Tetragenococcus koreensis]|uniref:TspO/MBR family protein n=1 Tax=Tetragenococcus koreensis TaxID=290335 RepID=UPI000F4F77C3|nr:TspO/MBR family protein [Tetragenococcus koreensis]AYW45555.1 sensory protein [Tetragenococcus koreensis]MCF1585563.1 tryptophan-rich sensory protein [Tetragenococcus koreensis]MCF1615109.1 tryptophan-rich sensory protein [Tetragenococcus koreensis]MCF1617745.1 tryptophan-rich sensory protein [Tetragenococcus koreensis]MCF1620699.1 tryptophan-rich sensory protein [Tetragenococcus koreensis]
MRKWVIWLISVVGIELTGIISGLFAGDIQSVYQELQKPPLSPPGNIIGTVWTILYALMGTALFLLIISKVANKLKISAITLFAIQQILNFSWSILFFGGNHYWIASLVIIGLIVMIIACIRVFYYINKAASYLFVPYLVWCFYAGYLCLGLAILN